MNQQKRNTACAKIYTLADENGNVFYVGSTIQPIRVRFDQHLLQARNTGYNPTEKCKAIVALDFNIVITVVDIRHLSEPTYKELNRKILDLEKEWIIKYLELGYKLTNRTAPQSPIMGEEKVGFSLAAKNRIIKRVDQQAPQMAYKEQNKI